MSDSLQPHELQHTRPPCPSPAPGVYSNSCPSSLWCHPDISFSVVPFSSCPHSLPASGSFPSLKSLVKFNRASSKINFITWCFSSIRATPSCYIICLLCFVEILIFLIIWLPWTLNPWRWSFHGHFICLYNGLAKLSMWNLLPCSTWPLIFCLFNLSAWFFKKFPRLMYVTCKSKVILNPSKGFSKLYFTLYNCICVCACIYIYIHTHIYVFKSQ